MADYVLQSTWEEVDAAAQAVANGLQKSQLAAGVRTSLDKADDAVQVGQQRTATDWDTEEAGIDENGKIVTRPSMSDEAKYSLLSLLSDVAYATPNGAAKLADLEDKLFPTRHLSSITAAYDQDRPIYDCDPLSIVKLDLVVTASYSDGTSETLSDSDYELSGTLTGGTSTITVSYEGKTDTIEVTVRDVPTGYTKYDYIERYAGNGASVYTTKASQIRLAPVTNLNEINIVFKYCAPTGHISPSAIFGRRDGTGYSKSLAFYADNASLGFHSHGCDGTPSKPPATNDVPHIVKYMANASSPSTVQVDDGTAVSITWANNNTLSNLDVSLLTNAWDDNSNSALSQANQCGFIRYYSLTGTLLAYYVIAVRDADNVIGVYDLVGQTFITCPTETNATVGNSNCKYKVGNWS